MGQFEVWRRRYKAIFPLSARQRAFVSRVKEVNIEISSYCNRSCPYCPNAYQDRPARQDIDADIVDRLLKDLARINYNGVINFNLYNEPLHDYDLFSRILAACKAHVPGCWLRLNSNGDYVTKEIMANLIENEIHEITFSIHYRDKWNTDALRRAIDRFLKRSGLPIIEPNVTEGNIWLTQCIGKTRVTVRSTDFTKFGADRGGLLAGVVHAIPRTRPCDLPAWQINVNYEGDLYPCCNIYPRKAVASDYRLGSLTDRSIFDVYFSGEYQEFIQKIGRISSNSDLPECCRSCCEERDKDGWSPFSRRRQLYQSFLGLTSFWL